MRRLRSSRTACGTARMKGVMASFMDFIVFTLVVRFRLGFRVVSRSHARGNEGKVFGAQGSFGEGRFLAARSAFGFLFTLLLLFTKSTCLSCSDASNTSLISG